MTDVSWHYAPMDSSNYFTHQTNGVHNGAVSLI